jgi:hypothetical protein
MHSSGKPRMIQSSLFPARDFDVAKLAEEVRRHWLMRDH